MSDFEPRPDSGGAGSLLAIGAALRSQGHLVDFEWKARDPALRIPHATAARLLELPRRQLAQVTRRLTASAYDVVVISQPFAYLVYERLAPRHPATLFLNRTHGWEARLYQAQTEFGFHEQRSAGTSVLSSMSAMLTRRACARTARASGAVITPSSLCATFIREHYGLPAQRVPVIPYGLSHGHITACAERPSRPPGRRMLFVGNYLRRKGCHVLEGLLPAVGHEFPDASLTFVTEKAAAFEIERRYRVAFGKRLTVLPWMDHAQLETVYATHDVLLFPSLFEGFGKAWMEAMAAGMCVVGFGEGGLPDLARSGEEAWFCSPGDLATLASLIRRALADPLGAAVIGHRAQALVAQYTWERTATETVEWCRRLRVR